PAGYSPVILGGYFRRTGNLAYTFAANSYLSLTTEGVANKYQESMSPIDARLVLSGGPADAFHYYWGNPCLLPAFSGKAVRLYGVNNANAPANITGGDGTIEVVMIFALLPEGGGGGGSATASGNEGDLQFKSGATLGADSALNYTNDILSMPVVKAVATI